VERAVGGRESPKERSEGVRWMCRVTVPREGPSMRPEAGRLPATRVSKVMKVAESQNGPKGETSIFLNKASSEKVISTSYKVLINLQNAPDKLTGNALIQRNH